MRARDQYPLYFLLAGWAVLMVAVIAELSGVLIAAGLLLSIGGVLLAVDYGGSVESMMRIFWREQFGRVRLLEAKVGRMQMQGIGVGSAVLGFAAAAGGIARVLNIGPFG